MSDIAEIPSGILNRRLRKDFPGNLDLTMLLSHCRELLAHNFEVLTTRKPKQECAHLEAECEDFSELCDEAQLSFRKTIEESRFYAIAPRLQRKTD